MRVLLKAQSEHYNNCHFPLFKMKWNEQASLFSQLYAELGCFGEGGGEGGGLYYIVGGEWSSLLELEHVYISFLFL